MSLICSFCFLLCGDCFLFQALWIALHLYICCNIGSHFYDLILFRYSKGVINEAVKGSVWPLFFLSTRQNIYSSAMAGGVATPPMLIVFHDKYTTLDPLWNVRHLGRSSFSWHKNNLTVFPTWPSDCFLQNETLGEQWQDKVKQTWESNVSFINSDFFSMHFYNFPFCNLLSLLCPHR